MSKYLYKRMWLICLIPLSVLIMIIADSNTYIAEHVFSGGICKLIMQILSTITGVVPFSVAEICVICSPLILIIILICFVKKIINSPKNRGIILYKALINVICVTAVGFFMYVMFDGINYYRYDFSYYAGFKVQKSSIEELYAVGEDLLIKAVDIRESLHTEDNRGVFVLGKSMSKISDDVLKAYERLGKKYPVLAGHYGKNKTFITSKYISYTKMVGVFVPFTLEANNNVDIVQYNIPSDMCHEQAHLRGFIKEDEANYIAYLACMESKNPEFNYSGLLQAYICVENAIYEENPGLCKELLEKMSNSVAKDIQANSEYWDKIENTRVGREVSDTTQNLNDKYLKANGENEGIKSYGLMVDLLISQYRDEGYFD